MMTEKNESHPCEFESCTHPVAFDDEPFCYIHSPDIGSTAAGYSYKARQPQRAVVEGGQEYELVSILWSCNGCGGVVDNTPQHDRYHIKTRSIV
jgi:hypothetical protein